MWAVTLVEPGSPADAAGVRRGDTLLSVDGVDVNTSSAGITPSAVGETTLRAEARRRDHHVTLASQKLAAARCSNTRVIDTPTGPVGYLQFNDHNAVAERQLALAFDTLRAGVNDLVLDMRYNGGGYLVVAAELAYMIAGPASTARCSSACSQRQAHAAGAAAVPVHLRRAGAARLASGVALLIWA
jgi:C-terminal processing protease CtpA/Prc